MASVTDRLPSREFDGLDQVQSRVAIAAKYGPRGDKPKFTGPPRGKRVVKERRIGPLPLADLQATFALENGQTQGTVEIVVLDIEPSDDSYTAGFADIPKLAQAGWKDFELGGLTICIRVTQGD